ncbi:N-acetylmuramoyl-L-alanine amidase [Pelagicoccus sp. SDUM812005]|uniref:N-acetylmuramoyl-L-alanine amidase n=1 Tax=Pelagicoccus sp. SDUM812005 TaxID=3041257 RepID=UPI00280F842A|nr:N-acetylmuramoyl-L-alanine amidase [Pelagicoccus sp. SDUM812005]MDQ8181549.1 N-acetylmuramoyl-L-alanine amidase [Pelagicoccus sp. SDUM812005]
MRFLLFVWLLGGLGLDAGESRDLERARRALGSERNWGDLARYDGAVGRDFFVEAMERTYAPTADWRRWMRVEADGVWIETGEEPGGERLFLSFAGEVSARKAEVELPEAGRKGFAGLRVVLDPGHIGGRWGPVEERSFAIGDGPLLQEGDLTLAVAKRIALRLRELGAEALLARETAEPVTALRAEDFWEEAKARLGGEEGAPALAERLFYRTAEIRERARRIEAWGGADLVLAIHINASGFEDPERPALHGGNDAHVLVHGCYLESELASPTQRLELLLRLFEGYHLEEGRVARALVEAMREETGLPGYRYEDGNAFALDEEGYLWARNLLASRIYAGPVVYLEPWQANGKAVYEWAAAGDYEGLREFDGELRPSLPTVYCEFVMAGLRELYSGGE